MSKKTIIIISVSAAVIVVLVILYKMWLKKNNEITVYEYSETTYTAAQEALIAAEIKKGYNREEAIQILKANGEL